MSKQDWRARHAERATGRLALTRDQIEAQRASVEITEEANGYTMRGNPRAKATLPADYVPTVFEEDAEMWRRINQEIGDA